MLGSSTFPRIGIPCQFNDEANSRLRVSLISQNASYVQCVIDAGGLPLLIPPTLTDAMLRDVYQSLHGLLLVGGVDIDPALYGEAPHPKLGRQDPLRDHIELEVTRWALLDRLPLFGVCRGIQILNVASGGSLYQDVAEQVAGALEHANGALPRDAITHSVRVTPGSRLHAILREAEVGVNSLHHQAVKRVAPGFTVTGESPDGLVEAMERADQRFCLAVQWHPEELTSLPGMRALFRAFVAAAAVVDRKS
jgi:putative glutamine amidotransferase